MSTNYTGAYKVNDIVVVDRFDQLATGKILEVRPAAIDFDYVVLIQDSLSPLDALSYRLFEFDMYKPGEPDEEKPFIERHRYICTQCGPVDAPKIAMQLEDQGFEVMGITLMMATNAGQVLLMASISARIARNVRPTLFEQNADVAATRKIITPSKPFGA